MMRRMVYQDFRLPDVSDVTDNERAWIVFLRDITNGRDPSPTLVGVQALQRALGKTGDGPAFFGSVPTAVPDEA